MIWIFSLSCCVASFVWSEEEELLIPEEAAISDETARYQYAEALSQFEAGVEEAYHQYGLLIDLHPDKALYFFSKGEISVRLQKFEEALSLLQRGQLHDSSLESRRREAHLLTNLGYPAKAKKQFQGILEKDPENVELLKEYASSLRTWGESLLSREIEERLKNPLGIIESYIAESRFWEAEAAIDAVLTQESEDPLPYFEKWILVKRRQRDFLEVAAIVDQAEKSGLSSPSLLYEKAYAFFKLERWEEAFDLCKALIESKEIGQQAEILQAKIRLKQGLYSEAEEILVRSKKIPLRSMEIELLLQESRGEYGCVDTDNTAQGLFVVASFFSEKGELDYAMPLVEEALTLDPDHFPSHIMQAELHSAAFQYAVSEEIYGQLFHQYPDNQALLYGLSRSYSWDKKYSTSINFYDTLIESDESDLLAKLERARVLYWAKRYPESMEAFDALLAILKYRNLEFARSIITLEKLALQWKWNYYQIEALKVMKRLSLLSPGSDYYGFEYGQALCNVGLCDEAEEVYAEIVKEIPLHTLAQFAQEREDDKERVEACLSYAYWNEIGYGELSQIGRYEVDMTVNVPISCRQKVSYMQRRWIEHTFYDSHYHPAHGQSLLWENRFSPYSAVKAAVTRKQYMNEFRPTYTGLAQFNFTLRRAVDCVLGYKRSDEIYNYFNLSQTTQANVFWGSCHCWLNHRTEGSLIGEFLDYNDINNQVHITAQLDHSFTEHPNIFKMSLSSEYRNVQHTNIYIYGPQGQLLDIIHPYWAPQGYFFGQLQLEWRRDYGFFQFCNAPERYYDIKFACGDDNNDNPFWQIKGEWHHEFYSGWKLTIAGYLHDSPQWRAKGLWCSLGMKF